jgi:Peptidase M50B-like
MTAASLAASLARIGEVQSHLSGPASFLMAIVAIGAVIVPGLWPITRHITTIAHEGAHAAMSSAIGRRVNGITFQLNGDAETRWAAGGEVGTAVIRIVGYLGPTTFGVGAAELIKSGYIVAVLWIAVVGLVAILSVTRSSFGIPLVVAVFVLLFLLTGFAAVSVQVLAAYAIVWFLLVSGVWNVVAHRKGAGDGKLLRDSTKIPHGFWVMLWLAGTVAGLLFGAPLLV